MGAPDLRTWDLRGGKAAHIPCANLGLEVGMGSNGDRHQDEGGEMTGEMTMF